MRNATPIAQELRGQRIDRRLTQAQLARVVGISVSTVGRAERGVMTAKTVSLLRQGLQAIAPSAS
jgi:transcriptional regulator with XRE-family HTH domain